MLPIIESFFHLNGLNENSQLLNMFIQVVNLIFHNSVVAGKKNSPLHTVVIGID